MTFTKFYKILASVVIVLCFSILSSCFYNSSPTQGTLICYYEHCFSVELAKTDIEKQQGLMFRTELGQQSGMLFVFDQPGIYSFWMKNTLIPLDMIRLDADFRVVDIQTAEPCTKNEESKTKSKKSQESGSCPSYIPAGSASYVLEINSGAAKYIGLQQGEMVDIRGINQ